MHKKNNGEKISNIVMIVAAIILLTVLIYTIVSSCVKSSESGNSNTYTIKRSISNAVITDFNIVKDNSDNKKEALSIEVDSITKPIIHRIFYIEGDMVDQYKNYYKGLIVPIYILSYTDSDDDIQKIEIEDLV